MAEAPEPWVSALDAAAVAALVAGRHADPFAVLGPRREATGTRVRAFLPGAVGLEVLDAQGAVVLGTGRRVDPAGLFEVEVNPPERYLLRITWPEGEPEVVRDPYSFAPLLSDFDLHLIAEGRHRELATCLGAQVMTVDGAPGVRFAVWAPNARRVSVVGDFNCWNGTRFPMRLRHEAGVWEMFLPGLGAGCRYKFELLDRDGQLLPQKADPMARATELPPANASVVAPELAVQWSDADWLAARATADVHARPLSIYEMHVGSWLRKVDDPKAGWLTLAEHLIPYLERLGFTHVELMPIMEHPFGGSWGYQPLSQFAPTARYGPANDFALFVDRCHAAGIGVILDWVPAHFPTDGHGLARFDGTALYEYLDPREGFHRDWNTYIYNLGRNEVRGFLVASALYWLEHFHVDGLRVDAVASMLYRDYSRASGEWLPNRYGGRENLEAIDFLTELNELVRARCPGALMIAEESTAWPGVTRSVAAGGLGFHYKWNMGWMHDTLRYMEVAPVYRPWHHDDMTFGMVYAYSEHFILPLSHDEVVYGKKSLLAKMPGDRWQQFAQLRAYLGFMWTHPGKKLLFMGGEIGQNAEWNHDGEIDWACLADPLHAGLQRLVGDLNALLHEHAALYSADSAAEGFQWLIGDDRNQSVFAYVRRPAAGHAGVPLVVVVNLTPVPRHGYRIGVPAGGVWRERLNSDAQVYGGSNVGNAGHVESAPDGLHGQAWSVELSLPPLALVVLAPRIDERGTGPAA